ncbi:hypothetical protein ILYODFUR_036685 [Ilyodon furcidens]|uniref:THAP-type domain-containing protein n=1 Tax=Ilyodon furcidens TaxID=33524 RepID=A0ABV0UNM3_9TELE
MGMFCCVGNCHFHGRKGKDNVFSVFQSGRKTTELSSQNWLAAIRRPDITFTNITRHMLVCSLRFRSGKFHVVIFKSFFLAKKLHISFIRLNIYQGGKLCHYCLHGGNCSDC